MINKSDILIDKVKVSADIINSCITEILIDQNSSSSYRDHTEGFINQFEVIKNAFEKYSGAGLQKVDIATRLSLIDLFYTTNFNRFAEFGLEELTDAIWNLCSDSQGNHSDSILVNKIEDFVSDCYTDPYKARESEVFEHLFAPNAKFGITKIEGSSTIGTSAQSLISKYFFFLLENHHSADNTLGFPIFDSIAMELQNPLIKKLGIKILHEKDIVGYIGKMTSILNFLKNPSNANNSVWNMPQDVCNTQFGLLDYFLWRIGKSGKFSFSLLWSKEEKRKNYIRVNNIKTNASPNPQEDFDSLPLRFKQWHTLYRSIKEI